MFLALSDTPNMIPLTTVPHTLYTSLSRTTSFGMSLNIFNSLKVPFFSYEVHVIHWSNGNEVIFMSVGNPLSGDDAW